LKEFSSLSPFPDDPGGLIADTGYGPDRAVERCDELVSRIMTGCGVDPRESFAQTPGAGAESAVLVIKTASHPWEVLDDWTLARVFEGQVVSRALFMPLGYEISLSDTGAAEGGNGISTEDYTGNLVGLIRQILSAPVGRVHLQVSPHTKSEFLVPLIRRLRPDCRLSVEFYDMGALFSRTLLSQANGLDRDAIDMTRFAAWLAAREADALVVKSTGADWARLAAQFPAKTVSWFPMARRLAEASAPRSTAETGERSVVFAGSLGDTELVRGRDAAPGANFLETLAQIMRGPGCRLTVFNAADRRNGGDVDARFQRVEAWFEGFGAKARYNAAVTEESLLIELARHDFGFFCVHYGGQRVEHVGRLAISNRVMAYLCAGLPIIVDAYAEATAELVRDFNAGIVVDPARYGDLPRLIAEADMAVLRAGVMRLRDHILATNLESLEVLRATIG
jgi:hypothetical protein